MSNLRTSIESRDAGEPSYQDHDREYTHVRLPQETPAKETTVETPDVAAQEQDSVSGSASPFNSPIRPRSVALATVAANAVHAAYEAGYAQGFSAGRLAALDFATALREAPTGQARHVKLTYDPGDKPF